MSAIKDYILGFYDGPHATPKEAGEGPIFLGIKNVTPDGRLDFSEIRHVSDAEFPKWTKRVTPKKDDIVFTYEASLHRYAIIPAGFHGCLGRRMALMRPDTTKVFPRFLHYYCLSSAWRKEAEASVTSGATVDRIPLTKVPEFKVDFPDLPTQERIAGILSAYDDLIENNRRRIALLEQAARLLYREWFVHFRFPSHETAKFVDGLPDGWKEVSISELADIFRGKSYRSTELGDGTGKPFINLKCFERGGGFRVSGLKWFTGEHKEQHIANTGDIVIAVTDLTRDAAVVAQAARVPRTVGVNAVYSMDLVKAVPKPDTNPVWFYGLLRFSRFSTEVKEGASGATVLHLKPKHIENWKLPMPPQDICELFAQKFEPILQQVDGLELQNGELTKARDLLLPRLMDGRIPVKV